MSQRKYGPPVRRHGESWQAYSQRMTLADEQGKLRRPPSLEKYGLMMFDCPRCGKTKAIPSAAAHMRVMCLDCSAVALPREQARKKRQRMALAAVVGGALELPGVSSGVKTRHAHNAVAGSRTGGASWRQEERLARAQNPSTSHTEREPVNALHGADLWIGATTPAETKARERAREAIERLRVTSEEVFGD